MIDPHKAYKTLHNGGWLTVWPVVVGQKVVSSEWIIGDPDETWFLFHDRRAQPDKAFHWRTESEVEVYGPYTGPQPSEKVGVRG